MTAGPGPPPVAGTRRGGDVPLRILLAEDDPISQRVARLVLTRLGHDVDVVGDGLEAVAAVRHGAYDVVLMDLQMPGLDGLGATRQIRSEAPSGRRTVIVAVTAGGLAAEQDACAAAGIDACLTKPLRPQDVAAVLGDLRGGTTAP